MKYETAVIKLETHNALFTFDSVRPFTDNVFGRDLMTNESNSYNEEQGLTAYSYLAAMTDEGLYETGAQKRAFARLVSSVILAHVA